MIKIALYLKRLNLYREEDIQMTHQILKDLSKFIKELFPYKHIDIFDITKSNEKSRQ